MIAARMWGVGIAVHSFEMDEPILVGCNREEDIRIHLAFNFSSHYSGCGKCR